MPSTNLSVVIWNIAHGRGLEKSNWLCGSPQTVRRRLDAIANVVSHADIALLQEVDFRAPWTYLTLDQRKYIQRKAGFPYRLSYASSKGLPSVAGLSTLSRLPLSEREVIRLPQHSRLESLCGFAKHALACTVRVPDTGQRFKLVNVHLSHRGHHVTTPGAKALLKYTREQEMPVLIGGDFNSTPKHFPGSLASKATGMDLLHASGLFDFHPQESPCVKDHTFPADDPRVILDWILIPALHGWTYTGYRVLHEQVHSDHLPVTARISIPAP